MRKYILWNASIVKSTFKVKQTCLNIKFCIKKSVGFNKNIAEVKEFPYSKVSFKNKRFNSIIIPKRTLDDVFTNKGQS